MADPRSVGGLKQALQRLPGVGPKSAQRMAFHLLERDREGARQIGEAIRVALSRVNHCSRCNNFSESELCPICSSGKRDESILCIVETPADLEAIEQAAIYHGMYFVLMGHLSPLDDIGPDQLGINELISLLEREEITEVILATNLTVEGEATAHFIHDLLRDRVPKISRIAHGVPLGGELEFIDGGTIVHAMQGRRNFS